MPPVTESIVVATELEKVAPNVPTLFDREDVFYSTIEKRPVEVISARDMRVPLELRPGGNFGHYDPDGGDLGRGDGPVFDKALINSVHLKIALEWTKKAEWATDQNRKAVLNTFRYLLAKSMSEFRRQCDSVCMTAGDGVVARASAVAIGTGTNGGDIWTMAAAGDGWGIRLLRFNQTVSVYNLAVTTKRAEVKINFYDLENKIVHTFPSLPTALANDVFLLQGLNGANPASLFGVPYHHSNSSTGNWLGLSRATNPEIRASRVNAGSGALALPFPRLAINKIGNRVGRDSMKKLAAWMHPCQQQAYEELGQLVSILNKSAKEEGLDFYFNDNMQMAGAPVKTSFSWDKQRIDMVAAEVWGRAELHPAGFYDVEGRKIFEVRGISGGVATAQLFYIVASFNLYTNNPAACAYIDALAIPSGY